MLEVSSARTAQRPPTGITITETERHLARQQKQQEREENSDDANDNPSKVHRIFRYTYYLLRTDAGDCVVIDSRLSK